MNTKLVKCAADVILAALTQNRTAAGIATALDSAQLLMSPETAAEIERLRNRVAELEAAPATVYRAEYNAIVLGYYRTRNAAREHCLTLGRRETPKATLEWRTDEPSEEDSPETLWDVVPRTARLALDTGYVVTPLEVPAIYDPDADE